MEIITLKTATAETKIFVGLPFADFKNYDILSKAHNDVVFITDLNVRAIYGNLFSEYQIIEIEPGETSKSLLTIENIYQQLIDYKIDRKGLIIGFGGGVVCDITGFVASTYLRGIRFGFAATSLLAQVDAAIGGKNGVNFLGFKNIIGTITQPEFVISDINMIDTVPEKEFSCGLAEIVKSAIAGNKKLFEFIEKNTEAILRKDKSILNKIITDTINFKVSIVEQDEKDFGIRHILNLGHTFAHAIESKTGMSHGEAVSIGLCKSAEISVKMGLLENSDYKRIISVLKKFSLPVETSQNYDDLIHSIMLDKKRDKNNINYILLKSIGEPEIHKFKIDELQKLF